MTEFSKNLQALRKEKKVTQEQLAGHLGVSAQAVSKWENGNYPESDLLPAIADFFGVSIDYLYGRGQQEKTIEQAVFDAVHECCSVEYERTGSSEAHNDFARLEKVFPDLYAFGNELEIMPDGRISWHIGAVGAAGTYEVYDNQLVACVSDIMEDDEVKIVLTLKDGELSMKYKAVPLIFAR